MATLSWQQTDGAGGASATAGCSTATGNASTVTANVCGATATAGGTELSPQVTAANGPENSFMMQFAATEPNLINWRAGNWTLRVNVTTENTDVVFRAIYICRFNSSQANQGTVGTWFSTGTEVMTAGTHTFTISGSSQTAGAGDMPYIVFVCDSNAAHGNDSWGITPNLLIDTPLGPTATGLGSFKFSDQNYYHPVYET